MAETSSQNLTPKTQEMAFKRLYFSKFSGGTCPRTPLGVLARSALVGRTDVRPPPPPPNFVTTYACELNFTHFQVTMLEGCQLAHHAQSHSTILILKTLTYPSFNVLTNLSTTTLTDSNASFLFISDTNICNK